MTADQIFTLAAAMVDDFAEEMVRLQADLVAREAVGPTSGGPGELAKADVFESWLEGLDLDWEIERVDAPDERAAGGVRPNLLAYTPEGEAGRLWILGHLDIVPPGEMSLWRSDPYTLVREGDKLYGRGTEDNHHALVMGYITAKVLQEIQARHGFRPRRGLGLAAVSDEETGSALGLEYVLRKRAELFSARDLIVIPDSGRPDGTLIEVAEKSMLWLKFRLLGRQVHGSRPETGLNTLSGAAHLIVALEELGQRFGDADPLYSPPLSTFPPTKKEANVPNVNTVPGEDVFYVDCRVLPHYPLDAVLAAARAIAGRVAEARGLTIEVEPVYRNDAATPTPTDAPVVQALQAAVAAVLGRRAEPGGIGGGTVAAFFRRLGLPAAVWQSAPETAHTPNEHCFLSDLVADAKVMVHLLLKG